MKKENTIIFAGAAGFLLAAIAVLASGLTIVPTEERTQAFWYRLVWTEVLVLLIYLPAFSFFKAADSDQAHGRSTIGVLPGAKIVLIAYALISFFLMMVNVYHHGEYLPNNIHLAVQIVITFLMGTIFTLMSVSYTTAATGLEKTFTPGLSPKELCDQLKGLESHLKAMNSGAEFLPLIQSLKKLRETIQYSIPHVGRIGESTAYQQHVDDVLSMINSTRNLDKRGTNIKTSELQIADLIHATNSIARSFNV